MTKRNVSLLLAVCMILSTCLITAFAEEPYEYSRIAYYNGGAEVTELTAGETTAKVKVKSESNTEPLYFAAILYKNNKIVAAGADETPDALSSSAVTYEATLTIPDDVTGLKLVTILWNNLKDMQPVCTSSIVPSSDARLLALSADGTEVEGFSPDVFEYTMTVDPAQVNAPYIRYKAADGGAKVTITDAKKFPGESIVEVTSADGSTTNTYKITYEPSEELLEITEKNVPESAAYQYCHDLQPYSSNVVANREAPITHVDESFLGLDYISCGFTTNAEHYIKFITRRGATIHALARPSSGNKDSFFPTSDGWVKDDKGWDRSIENNWNKIEDPNGTYEYEGKMYRFEPFSEIGDGLTPFPVDSKANEYVDTKYDHDKQGWIYWNYRKISTQTHRGHTECAFSIRYSKYFEPAEITINESVNSMGVPIIIEWDEYRPNDYSELSL